MCVLGRTTAGIVSSSSNVCEVIGSGVRLLANEL